MKKYSYSVQSTKIEIDDIKADNDEEMLIEFKKQIIDYVNKLCVEDLSYFRETISG